MFTITTVTITSVTITTITIATVTITDSAWHSADYIGPTQELEVGPRSGPFLLVLVKLTLTF